MPRRPALIASTLAVAVLLVGCGGDDDTADDGDTTTTAEEASTATTAEAADEPATGEPTTTSGGDGTESTEPADDPTTSAPDAGAPGDPEFCAAYGALDERFEDVPNDTLEEVRASTTAIDAAIDDLVPLAPDELAEQMEVLAQAVDELVDAAATATSTEEALAALEQVFSDQAYGEAALAVDDYFEDRCPEADDEAAEGSAPTPTTVTPG